MEDPFYMHACPMPPLILCQGTIHRRRHVTGEGTPVSTAGIFKEAFNSKSDVFSMHSPAFIGVQKGAEEHDRHFKTLEA